MRAICCGLPPFPFGGKSLRIVQKTSRIFRASRSRRRKGLRKENLSQSACNFILMMELRKKILTFRDIIDLPPCNTSGSTYQLMLRTMKDLHKFYPESIPQFNWSELKGLPLEKVLIHFCKALQDLGNTSKMNDEWIDKYENDIDENDNSKKVEKLVEFTVATLNGLIKIAREKFDIMDDDDIEHEKKDESSTPKGGNSIFGKVLKDEYLYNSEMSSTCPSPLTPTSVLPDQLLMNGPPRSPYSSSLLLSLRVQSLGKLNPVDVKRLTLHMLPSVGDQVPNSPNQNKIVTIDDQKEEKELDEAKGDSPDIIVKQSSVLDETISSDENIDHNSDGGSSNKDESAVNVAPAPPSTPSEMQPLPDVWRDIEVTEEKLSSPPPPPPPPPAVLTPSPPSDQSTDIDHMEVDRKLPLSPPTPPPPPPPFLPKNVAVTRLPLPPPTPPPMLHANGELATQPKLLVATTEPQLSSPLSPRTNAAAAAATGIPSPPPPPPAPLKSNVVAKGAAPPPPPPVPSQSNVEATGAPVPPPPPAPPKAQGSASVIPPPPAPARMLSKGSGPLQAPPPPAGGMSSAANGPTPPPPPLGAIKSLRPKRASTKLKRSTHMGNLYRVLKGKVEGRPLQAKASPNGRKNAAVGSSGSGKKGMADALAEMTKRSTYFQQIEEDIQKYSKQIKELKTAISTFNTKDMSELLKFHKHVESILENLTDETQVLARFEGFPSKKLEALRIASALYSKLESMVTELQNWKIEPPLGQLLDKVDRYFNKIKGDIDALERTKDEESKKLKSHNIQFDFDVLDRIKEAMVDVSSNCMELALKERREIKVAETEESKSKVDAQKKDHCAKMLWRAFQFAFRVYTFAGGHDERADELTRELAREIETDPRHL